VHCAVLIAFFPVISKILHQIESDVRTGVQLRIFISALLHWMFCRYVSFPCVDGWMLYLRYRTMSTGQSTMSNDDMRSVAAAAAIVVGAATVDAPAQPATPPLASPITTGDETIGLAQDTTALNEPAWQEDSSAGRCGECGVKFTLFTRRHHCRRCGLIYCGNCCWWMCKYPPGSFTVWQDGNRLARRGELYRTCGKCREELREFLANDITCTDENTIDDSDDADAKPAPRNIRSSDGHRDRDIAEVDYEDDEDVCPVCGERMSTMSPSEGREEHVERCLRAQEFGSPPTDTSQAAINAGTGVGSGSGARRRNRMVLSRVQPGGHEGECVICLEDMCAGQKVGRLECLCCFHAQCIKDWARKRGFVECPVHKLYSE
jgi:hypothetical protein